MIVLNFIMEPKKKTFINGEEFVHKTGKFNEEEEDYELKVNSFHDYLLSF